MNTEIIVINGSVTSWEEAIRLTARSLYNENFVTEEFADKCIEREMQFPTGLETLLPVAIPHTDAEFVKKSAICVLKLEDSIMFNNMEDINKQVKVQFVMNLALSKDDSQVEVLKKIIHLFQEEDYVERIVDFTPFQLQDFFDYHLK